jgi:ATP-dependent helicase Lhr and Lhr-like helicase
MAGIANPTTQNLNMPADSAAALAVLPLPLRNWFLDHFARPTPAQCFAWPTVAAGHNLLLSAPTGTGKTLAAFVPILGQFLAHRESGVHCIYVAPLKALLADVYRTIRRAIQEIAGSNRSCPSVARIALRTGDTGQRARRQMVRKPPTILLTTPESLAVLLTQIDWIAHFSTAKWLIVDEVHALATGKRGADLSLSMERLEQAAGRPLIRLGLSATCAPLDRAAHFLVGSGRTCLVAQVADATPVRLDIEPLAETGAGFFTRLVQRVAAEIRPGSTTLVFTNARGAAERLTWALRQLFPEHARRIAAHHSCLAPGRRRRIERALKRGRQWCVVSSTSLELGIDIGSVDRVVLVHPPGGVGRLMQRLGRSGHRPGQCRRGLVLTSSRAELLEAAVTCTSSGDAQLEHLDIANHPLDVLCQHLLGMAATSSWIVDDAFSLVRKASPYCKLTREDFDSCLAYLSGQRSDCSDWLPPRLRWEGGAFTLVDSRTATLLRRNLGTIFSEDTRTVVNADGAWIGSLEEAYASGLQPGDRFLLDGRCLQVRLNHPGMLEVEDAPGRPLSPRWLSEAWPLSRDLAARLFTMRVRAAEALLEGPAKLLHLLGEEYGLKGAAAAELADYFQRQQEISEIPGRDVLLIELIYGESVGEYYLHTPLHHAANDALARVAAWRLARGHARSCSTIVADLGLMLCTAGEPLTPDLWRVLLSPTYLADDLRQALAESDLLRGRFQRVAYTGFMLVRNPLGKQRKVGGASWPARRLFDDVVRADANFVLMRQARREVEESLCNLEAAAAFAQSLQELPVRIRRLTAPSPFVEHWSQALGGPGEQVDSPEDALRRLHALLTAAGAV